MSGFLDPLRVEQIDFRAGRPVWKTLAPLRYVSERLGTTVTVPAEFQTDLASVPRLMLTWVVAGGRAPRPAVVHDYLYAHPDWTDRAAADDVLREAMAADPMSGTNSITRALMFAGVRAGGWWPWRKYEKHGSDLNPIWDSTAWPEAPEAT